MTMTISRQILVGIVLIVTSEAAAFDTGMQMTGADFSRACTQPDESWISFCNGHIQATVDNLRKGDGICIPSGTTRTDLVTASERAITGSSQFRALNAQEAVLTVLRQTYPC
nr:Rap1a/Tai family immunity protein [Aminobacter aminovorans]